MTVPDTKVERDHYRDLWWPLFLEFNHALLSRARGITSGNIFDAEDLVHDTVCRVIRYPRNPETLASPLGYLIRIMRNVWIDRVVGEASGLMDSLDDPLKTEALEKQLPAIDPEALRLLENKELLETLKVRQGPLNPRERDLLRLCLEGMTCEEIAKQWGEDIRVIRSDWNALKAKIKYRVRPKSRETASGQ